MNFLIASGASFLAGIILGYNIGFHNGGNYVIQLMKDKLSEIKKEKDV